MPADNSIRVHNDERFRPTGPQLLQQDPKQPVQWTQARPGPFALERRNLLAKRKHLESEVRAAAEEDAGDGKQCENE